MIVSLIQVYCIYYVLPLFFLPGSQEIALQIFGTSSQEIFHFEGHIPVHTLVHTQHTSNLMHVVRQSHSLAPSHNQMII